MSQTKPNSREELNKVLHTVGTRINEVYTSEATTPWCTVHYFKLIKGVCVGCEAVQALDQHLTNQLEKAVESNRFDWHEATINQLNTEKYKLKLMVQRRNKEINAQIKNIEDFVAKAKLQSTTNKERDGE